MKKFWYKCSKKWENFGVKMKKFSCKKWQIFPVNNAKFLM